MLTIRFDRLGLRPGAMFLDAGAGFGRHAFEAARKGATVFALDWAQEEVVGTRNTFGAMIEAMATGTCLVATDGGALPEVTGTDGETVLQCPAGDADALAAAIRRGLEDSALRDRNGAAGRRRVVERWSWRHCAQLTVDQYREVLAMPHNQKRRAR